MHRKTFQNRNLVICDCYSASLSFCLPIPVNYISWYHCFVLPVTLPIESRVILKINKWIFLLIKRGAAALDHFEDGKEDTFLWDELI